MPIQKMYIENFTTKNWKFSDKKNPDIFYISDQNIDCGYSLEPLQWGVLIEIRKIMYTPVNPIYYIKMGFKGVKVI